MRLGLGLGLDHDFGGTGSPIDAGFILQEDSFFILQEDGFKLIYT